MQRQERKGVCVVSLGYMDNMNQGSCSAAAIINFSDSCERGSIEHLNGEGSATILADLKSTAGSMMFPYSSFCLLILSVASMEVIVIQSMDKPIWLPVHFLLPKPNMKSDGSSMSGFSFPLAVRNLSSLNTSGSG